MPSKFLRDLKKSENEFSVSLGVPVSGRSCTSKTFARLNRFRIFAACIQTVAVLAVAQTVFVHSNAQSVFAAGDSDWVEDGVDTIPSRRAEPASQDDQDYHQIQQPKPRLRMSDSDEDGPINESDSPRQSRQPERKQRVEKQTRQSDETLNPPADETPMPTDIPVGEIRDDGVRAPVNTMGKTEPIRVPIQGGISTWKKGTISNGMDDRAAMLMQSAPIIPTPKIVGASQKVLKGWFEANHPGLIAKIAKDAIVEVKGEWDDSGHVIRTFGIPFKRVLSQDLAKQDLSKSKIVVVNCEGHLSREAIHNLRGFVSQGGYLLSTDWALQNVIEQAFPGVIEAIPGTFTSEFLNVVVPAVVVSNDPELTAGATPVGSWELVKKSQLLRVIRTAGVQVLARSKALYEKDDVGILAVVFNYRKGRVMHLVGHFDFNSELRFNTAVPDSAPTLGFSLRQAFAANFIAQALQSQPQASEPEGTDEALPEQDDKQQE